MVSSNQPNPPPLSIFDSVGVDTGFIRDTVIATALLGALYVVAPHSSVRFLQIPGYLLIVGFDMLEAVFGPVQSFFDVVFGLYLVGLGGISASIAHGIRRVATKTTLPAWRVGIAGVLTVIASIALLYGAIVYAGTTQSEPVRILVGTGLILVVLAALFANVFDVVGRIRRIR